jgi:hypothetical protein
MRQIKESQNEHVLVGGIVEVEVSTTTTQEKGGKFKIHIIEAGKSVSGHEVQKIKIPLRVVSETYKKIQEAKVAQAEALIAQAEAKKATSKAEIAGAERFKKDMGF